MANLTLAIEEELLKKARKLAIDRDTTVNRMVRDFLEAQVTQASRLSQARERLLRCRLPGKNVTWTREDLYER
ncbi:MAG: DUF6364 family protein [Bryobacteraceae bacterium]